VRLGWRPEHGPVLRERRSPRSAIRPSVRTPRTPSSMRHVSEPRARADGVVIALSGSFNPPIFHPSWFVGHRLLEEAEADTARNVEVDAYWSVFEVRWFGFEASRERLTITSTPATESYSQLRDLAADVFSLLSHTPVSSVTLLRFRHLAPPDHSWATLTNRLCPLAPWSGVLDYPEVEHLALRSTDPTGRAERINVGLQPSRLIKGGVYISLTHYYALPAEPVGGAKPATGLLLDEWDAVLDRSDSIIGQLAGWHD
jgi:hypothetical protein